MYLGCHPEHDIIPDGTIAQLGERATEVRKVAGSIPARPITFCIFLTYLLTTFTWGDRKNDDGLINNESIGWCVMSGGPNWLRVLFL